MTAIDFVIAQDDVGIAAPSTSCSSGGRSCSADGYVETMHALRASDGLQLLALREAGYVRAIADPTAS
jgi:hypothetical protein